MNHSIPALSFDDAQFISAYRALATLWNTGEITPESNAALAPLIDAFELEAISRGMVITQILKGCE